MLLPPPLSLESSNERRLHGKGIKQAWKKLKCG
jgi:hypothetical protein